MTRQRDFDSEALTDSRGVEYVEDAAFDDLPRGWALCNTCERAWNDDKSTSVTPAPSGRCPFESEHDEPDDEPQRDTYNGWANRETWAVALYVNNDQGWQESVLDALRAWVADMPNPDDEIEGATAYGAGQVVREQVEALLNPDQYADTFGSDQPRELARVLYDIGSLYRVDWSEIGASFLDDLSDES